MKNILKTVLLAVFVLTCQLVQAQNVNPLHIGDKVPDIAYTKMLNHKASNGRLSDFKGKAIIIDLWFKECGGCIGAMPHLDSLQNEFKDDLQVLLITWQTQAEIMDFWRRNLDVGKYRFVQAVEDTITRKLFPAVAFPHQIWISKEGVVTAITDGQGTTRDEIKKLITNSKLSLREKKDEMDANVRWGIAPLMNIRYDDNKDKILNYSYFSKYRPELNGSATHEIDSVNRLVRMKFSNMDYITLYHYAYVSNMERRIIHRPTRMIRLDHSDLPRKLDFLTMSTSFCYDLIYKDTSKTLYNFGKHMTSDLDRFFDVKSHEELREISCYIISPNGKGIRFRETINPDGKKHVYNMSLETGKLLSVSRQLPSFLEGSLMDYADKPLLFEMGNEKKLNFEVVWNLDNLKQMNLELEKYDLKIEKAMRKRKVIILEDPK